MTERTGPKLLPLHLVVALSLIAILILASCFSRQLNGHGWDFAAYYRASERFLRGESPYFYEKAFSYKYAPVVVLPFTFFNLFSFETARWIYAALHALVALSLPYVLYQVLEKDKRLKISLKPEVFAMGLLVAFLGCFRFIDSEFHVSQIGLWIAWLLIAGVWVLQRFGHRVWGRICGLVLISLASLVKIHSAIFFVTFAKMKEWKSSVWVAGVFLVVAMLPNPAMWLDWAEQIRRTTFDLPMDASSVNLQGFYPLGVLHFGMNQFSAWPLLLTLPFLAMTILSTAHYSLRDLKESSLAVLLSLSTWLLLGFLASPLPWQYTYSILWMLFPLSWVASTTRERRWLLGIALFLGLSPQGIIGKHASMWIESRQSVFFAILIFWTILLKQASRWKLRSARAPSQKA
ncbi:MAG: glycosyltransferase 87 family protein [Bdellovibrionota bacterium]